MSLTKLWRISLTFPNKVIHCGWHELPPSVEDIQRIQGRYPDVVLTIEEKFRTYGNAKQRRKQIRSTKKPFEEMLNRL